MRVEKAGCVLINRERQAIALVYRQKQDDYTFPKGHVEQGETLEECALRETAEEVGRTCQIRAKLPPMIYMDSLGCPSRTHYFLAIDTGADTTQYDADLVHELVWMPITEISQKLSYQNLKEYWQTIQNVVLEQMNQNDA